MVNSEKQQSTSDRKNGDAEDCIEESYGVDSTSMADASSSVEGSPSVLISSGSGRSGLTDRLSENLPENGDGDLLLQQAGREENFLQWLRALGVQAMGACRADERLKPLLKLNVSTGAAEDRLLAQLSQHFDPSEVGMLARCLCVPLVSVRVGKINKQGNLLCPTATRGNLNLTLLLTSDLRLSFVGDDGLTERLATLSIEEQHCYVQIEEISADKSGRSFSIKVPGGDILYFWCSEKLKLVGSELLGKMKDLLERKPSLAELTGISESRLDSFAIHLQAYLLGSTMTNALASNVSTFTPSQNTSADPCILGLSAQSSASFKLSRYKQNCSRGVKISPLHQGSLNPRSSSFKDGMPRNLSSLKGVSREKFKRRLDNLAVMPPKSEDAFTSNYYEDKSFEATQSLIFPSSNIFESLGKSGIDLPVLTPTSQFPLSGVSSVFSPLYCWCPPVASTLQFTAGSSPLFKPLPEIPPLPSLLSVNRSPSFVTGKHLNLADVPSLDLPPLLPDPLVRFPFSLPTSQTIPTFTPLMCDPIVHIPVIDVCSSGQGYLVSAGPAMSTAIPPLHPNLVSPRITDADSVEKGARETLRLLINSSNQTNPPLIDVFPSVLSSSDKKQSILVTGSRGLYIGARDIVATANSIASMGLVMPLERYSECSVLTSRDDLVREGLKSDCSGSSDGFPDDVDEKRTD